MPRGDGTGPAGGISPNSGRGIGRNRGNRPGAGPSGTCVCPECGYSVAHRAGSPCFSIKCPKCGTRMIRG